MRFAGKGVLLFRIDENRTWGIAFKQIINQLSGILMMPRLSIEIQVKAQDGNKSRG